MSGKRVGATCYERRRMHTGEPSGLISAVAQRASKVRRFRSLHFHPGSGGKGPEREASEPCEGLQQVNLQAMVSRLEFPTASAWTGRSRMKAAQHTAPDEEEERIYLGQNPSVNRASHVAGIGRALLPRVMSVPRIECRRESRTTAQRVLRAVTVQAPRL